VNGAVTDEGKEKINGRRPAPEASAVG
jgi:hypothetical protein